MVSELEHLHTALLVDRLWRDWGTRLLLVGVLLEGLIDIFWPEPILLLRRWIDRLKTPAVVIAFLLVFAGIGLEMWYGAMADDDADQIRINLETKLVQVSPRPELLYGKNGERLAAQLKRWAGQSVEIRFCGMYLVTDEAIQTAMRLGWVFSRAGWVGEPGFQIGAIGSGWIAPRKNDSCNGEGFLVEEAPDAPDSTRKAANGLIAALKGAPFEAVNDSVDDLQPSELKPLDPKSVIVTVFGHPM
jgi:hypothetical protein